jgi:catechol 2,3-dioxygenase-like lactoylglutathione lyase family enzyme
MSRVQLALNVENLDDAVDFYRKLFATEPAKRRPGYANFVIANPPPHAFRLTTNALRSILRSLTGADRSLGPIGHVASEAKR